jgi:hypothetical protein
MIQQVRNGEWISTLLGPNQVFTSEQSATHYDSREARRTRAASEGETLLAGMTTEQIKSVSLALSREIDANLNRPDAEIHASEFMASRPEVEWNGPHGVAVMGAIRGRLMENGFTHPFNAAQLSAALSELIDLGAVKPTGAAPKNEDPAAKFVSPLDIQTHEMNRISKLGNLGY